jgi:uncharacterized membrane protein YeaQ/YmgE (transglycosylase-associated protein family)
MGLVSWLLFGLMAGVISVVTDEQPSLMRAIVIGMVGALIGGVLLFSFGFPGFISFHPVSFAGAVVGALVFLTLTHQRQLTTT